MAFEAGALTGKASLNSRPWQRSLKRMSTAVQDMGKKTNKGFSAAGAGASKFGLALKAAALPVKAVGKIAKTAFNMAKKALVPVAGIAAGVTTGMGVAIKRANDYEVALGNVNSILGGTGMQIDELSRRVLRLGPELGDVTSNMEAMYMAISAGATTTESAMSMVTSATKLAGATLIESSTAVDILSTATQGFTKHAVSAEHASDLLTKTIKLGKTTGPELAASLGKAIPTFNSAGLSMEELTAATAALTKGGVSTSEAITQLQGMMNTFIKPSAEMEEALAATEYGTAQNLLQTEGLAGALEFLTKEYKGNLKVLGTLARRTEAMNAIQVLTLNGSKEYTEILKEMQEASGATEEAFAAQEMTFKTMKNAIKNAIVELGLIFKPLAKLYSEEMIDKIQRFRDYIKTPEGFDKVASVFERIAAVGITLKETFGFIVEEIFNKLSSGASNTNLAMLSLSSSSGIAGTMIAGIGGAMKAVITIGIRLRRRFNRFFARQEKRQHLRDTREMVRMSNRGQLDSAGTEELLARLIDTRDRAHASGKKHFFTDIDNAIKELQTGGKISTFTRTGLNIALQSMFTRNRGDEASDINPTAKRQRKDAENAYKGLLIKTQVGTADSDQLQILEDTLVDMEESLIESNKEVPIQLTNAIRQLEMGPWAINFTDNMVRELSKRKFLDHLDVDIDYGATPNAIAGDYVDDATTEILSRVMQNVNKVNSGIDEVKSLIVEPETPVSANVGAYEQVSQITARSGGGVMGETEGAGIGDGTGSIDEDFSRFKVSHLFDEKFWEKTKEETTNIDRIQAAATAASQAIASLNQIASAALQQQLAEVQAARDEELSSLHAEYEEKKKLASGNFYYQKRIHEELQLKKLAINDKYAKKEDDIKRRHFEATKALRISEVIMSMGQAIAGALTATVPLGLPAFPIVFGILSGLIATAAGVQIGMIAGQQYVASRARGGMASGLTRVNEAGGEIITLPDNSQVIPADISRQIARASGQPTPVMVNINLDGAQFSSDVDVAMIGEVVSDTLRQQRMGA